jgi:hypothetical protein
MGYGGLAQEELTGGTGKAAMLDDAFENAELMKRNLTFKSGTSHRNNQSTAFKNCI